MAQLAMALDVLAPRRGAAQSAVSQLAPRRGADNARCHSWRQGVVPHNAQCHSWVGAKAWCSSMRGVTVGLAPWRGAAQCMVSQLGWRQGVVPHNARCHSRH